MAVTNAISDLFASVYELFASLLGAIYTIIHSFVAGIASLFVGFINFFADISKGVVDVVGGVGKFVAGMLFSDFPLFISCQGNTRNGFSRCGNQVIEDMTEMLTHLETGNFVVLALIAGGVFAYFRFTAQGQMQAQQGRSVAAKKTN